mgnify:FL=1
MSGFKIGDGYGGIFRNLGQYNGGSTLTTNYSISKSTAGGCAIVLCSNHGSTTLSYIRAGLYLIEFPYYDTLINVSHVAHDHEWTFGVSSNVLTVTGGSQNWTSTVVLLGNKS